MKRKGHCPLNSITPHHLLPLQGAQQGSGHLVCGSEWVTYGKCRKDFYSWRKAEDSEAAIPQRLRAGLVFRLCLDSKENVNRVWFCRALVSALTPALLTVRILGSRRGVMGPLSFVKI